MSTDRRRILDPCVLVSEPSRVCPVCICMGYLDATGLLLLLRGKPLQGLSSSQTRLLLRVRRCAAGALKRLSALAFALTLCLSCSRNPDSSAAAVARPVAPLVTSQSEPPDLVLPRVLLGPDEQCKLIRGASGKTQEKDLAQAEAGGFLLPAEPMELQFGCVRRFDAAEDAWAELLDREDGRARAFAARVLWEHRARQHALRIFQLSRSDPALATLRKLIDRETSPKRIVEFIVGKDPDWGLWLARVRPHPSLIPSLIDGLPDPAAMYALGISRDPRAKEPLVREALAGGYRSSGDAAKALGLLGDPSVEPVLIELLGRESGWGVVNAAMALEKIGTVAAIPALRRHAESNAYTGALSIRRSAQAAIKAIEARGSK